MRRLAKEVIVLGDNRDAIDSNIDSRLFQASLAGGH